MTDTADPVAAAVAAGVTTSAQEVVGGDAQAEAAAGGLTRPLRDRDFRLYFSGQAVSLLGDQFYFIALAWVALTLTGSGLVPRAVLMLVGGAMSDRYAPRRILLFTNGARGLATAALALLIAGNLIALPHLYVVALLFGALDAFYYPALGTFVPTLVRTEELAPANGLLQGTEQLMGLVGPPLAGLVVAVATPGPAFLVDALSFAVAFGTLLFVRERARARAAAPGPDAAASAAPAASDPPTQPRQSVLAEIRAGAAYAAHDRTLRTLLVLAAMLNLAIAGPAAVGLPWLVQHRLGGGSFDYGLIVAAIGGGSLLGALFGGARPLVHHRGTILMAVGALLGLGIGAMGMVPTVAAAIVVALPMGLLIGYTNVSLIAWLQARVEPALMGRVISLSMLSSVGLTPISYALAGALIDTNEMVVFGGAACLMLATVLVALAWGARQALD